MSRIYKEVDARYASICSLVTICFRNKGFLYEFMENLGEMASIDNWLDDVLVAQRNDAAKLEAIMRHENITKKINNIMSRVRPVDIERNVGFSEQMAKNVTELMESGNLHKALSVANQAVIFAPQSVEESLEYNLSSALWLRSEILLDLKMYELALRDLKLALKKGLTVRIRADYYWRLGHAYKGVGNVHAAKTSYELAILLFKNADEGIIARINEDIKSISHIEPTYSGTKPEIKLTLGPKENLPSLSKLVKIAEKENVGRFAVADTNIETGAVLLVEAPYAASLDPELYGTHCLHCFKRFQAPIGCPTCKDVAFCDLECQRIALTTYHRYECKFNNLFIGSGMSVLSLLALRMVTQMGLEACRHIHSEFLSADVKPINTAVVNDIEGSIRPTKRRSRKDRPYKRVENYQTFKKNEEPQPSTSRQPAAPPQTSSLENKSDDKARAGGIYSLCTHNEFREPEDYLHRFMMAMFLKQCLLETEFFEKSNSEVLKNDEKIVLELLLRNLQILQFNAHQLYEVLRGSHYFNGSKTKYIGVAIYPTASLFNHDCYPSVARFFDGKNIVLRTTRPVDAGHVVGEHYGPNFLSHDLHYRQRELACRYWFRCQCVSCIENWPTLAAMVNEQPMLRCPTPDCTNKFVAEVQNIPNNCDKCNIKLDKSIMKRNVRLLKETIKNFEKGACLMCEQNVPEATATLIEAMNSYHNIGAVPFKAKHLAEEALRACYSYYGNFANV